MRRIIGKNFENTRIEQQVKKKNNPSRPNPNPRSPTSFVASEDFVPWESPQTTLQVTKCHSRQSRAHLHGSIH